MPFYCAQAVAFACLLAISATRGVFAEPTEPVKVSSIRAQRPTSQTLSVGIDWEQFLGYEMNSWLLFCLMVQEAYFEIMINKEPVGYLNFNLRPDVVPKTVKNFVGKKSSQCNVFYFYSSRTCGVSIGLLYLTVQICSCTYIRVSI